MEHRAIPLLRAEVLWLATRRTAVDGRACRQYDVTTEAGEALLIARAFLWGREMPVTTPDGRPVFRVLRSRVFPLTGKAAVKELPSGTSLGIVSRNGTFLDSHGAVRGRFRDARSFRHRAVENAFYATMEAVLSAADSSEPSGPDALVLEIEGTIAGTLTYEALPFAASEAPRHAAMSARARTVVPRFLRKTWRSLNKPRGWKFARVATSSGDPRLELAAALFAAEISRW